jgi:hypothetical protein
MTPTRKKQFGDGKAKVVAHVVCELLRHSEGRRQKKAVSSVVLGAITYPLFAHWAWGGGWLSKLGGCMHHRLYCRCAGLHEC